jgi:hypothetical protein
MSFYSRKFAAILGCSDEDAARIEVLVRWERPTLNALSNAELRAEAKIAAQMLAQLRAELAAGDESNEAKAMLAQIAMEAEGFAG